MLPTFFSNREWSNIYVVFIFNGMVASITGFGNIDGKGLKEYKVYHGETFGQPTYYVHVVGDEEPDIVTRDEFEDTFLGNGKYSRVIWNKFTLME